jgi:hypothetical protein
VGGPVGVRTARVGLSRARVGLSRSGGPEGESRSLNSKGPAPIV